MYKVSRILEGCLNMNVSLKDVSALSESEKRDFLQHAEPLQCNLILKALENVDAPKGLIESTRLLMLSNVRRGMIILSELRKMSALLNEEKIDFVVLKGFSFGRKRIYSRMHDIDFLIRKKDLEKCEAIALKNGFVVSPDKSRKYWISKGYHTKYSKKTNPDIQVEFHWDTENKCAPFHMNLEKIMSCRKKARVSGITFYSLSREDMLLHLAMHATYHHSMINPTKDIFLLHEEIKKGGVNWKKLVLLSEKTGSASFLYEALLLSQKKFFSDMPGLVMIELKKKSSRIQLFILRLFEHQCFDYLNMKEVKIRRFIFAHVFRLISRNNA